MAEQLFLGIDTATDVEVGLADGDRVLSSVSYDDPRRHVEQLAPLIERVFNETGVSATRLTKIIVGVGPGPYTGLRVGIATARTMASALGIEVCGVCSLDVLAAQWLRSEAAPIDDFLIITDARRKEVYWARYAPDGSRVAGPAVGKANEVPALPVGGPATLIYPELQAAPSAPLHLDAGVLALAGPELAEVGLEPLYLRSPDATPPGPRKSVLPRVLS